MLHQPIIKHICMMGGMQADRKSCENEALLIFLFNVHIKNRVNYSALKMLFRGKPVSTLARP